MLFLFSPDFPEFQAFWNFGSLISEPKFFVFVNLEIQMLRFPKFKTPETSRFPEIRNPMLGIPGHRMLNFPRHPMPGIGGVRTHQRNMVINSSLDTTHPENGASRQFNNNQQSAGKRISGLNTGKPYMPVTRTQ